MKKHFNQEIIIMPLVTDVLIATYQEVSILHSWCDHLYCYAPNKEYYTVQWQ